MLLSYNQEDSMIMNQSSIDRGLFRSLFFRSYMDLEKRQGMKALETFEKPSRSDTLRLKHGTYEKLDDDGLIGARSPCEWRGISSLVKLHQFRLTLRN